MQAYNEKLTRAQVAKVLRRAAAISELARELGKHRNSVSDVLRGKMTSASILAAAEAKAREILASEAAQ